MKQQACAGILRLFAAAATVLTLSAGVFAQTETILLTFTGGSDGGSPQAGLVFDSKGNLYGTTSNGGSGTSCGGCGTAFELVPNSNGTWTENVLYSFGSLQNFGDGVEAYGGLIFDSKGNLYGTTISGGDSFQGVVFELVAGSNGTWTEKVLYSFTGGNDGGFPYGSGLTFDNSGNLYGMTESGRLWFWDRIRARRRIEWHVDREGASQLRRRQ